MTRAELQTACATLGLTLRGLARLLGIPENTPGKWGGRNRAVPAPVVAWLLAELAHRAACLPPRLPSTPTRDIVRGDAEGET
jgi:hypothetical protein